MVRESKNKGEMVNSMKPKVSIIMPVYNAEKYLEAAIESILRQTYKNFELLLVDDGSKDRSADICDRFAQQDSRVIAIHQKNSGICVARNVGLKASTGDYITFCDNDDEYASVLLEKGMGAILKEKADLVKYGKKILYEGKDGSIEQEEIDRVTSGVYDKSVIRENFSFFDEQHFFGFIWDGIYSRDLLVRSNPFADKDVLLFNQFYKTGYEDVDYNYMIVPFCRKMVCLDECYYIHYIRCGYSTTLKYSYNRIQSLLRIWDKKYEVMSSWNLLTDEKLYDDNNLLCMNGEICASVASVIWSPSCKLNRDEKKTLLMKFASHPLVAVRHGAKAKVKAFKRSKSRFIVWQLLQWRMFNLVLFMGYFKKRLIDASGLGKGLILK